MIVQRTLGHLRALDDVTQSGSWVTNPFEGSTADVMIFLRVAWIALGTIVRVPPRIRRHIRMIMAWTGILIHSLPSGVAFLIATVVRRLTNWGEVVDAVRLAILGQD